jgi:hypothetical protein
LAKIEPPVSENVKVVILCGGMGTRLREEMEFRPKTTVNIGARLKRPDISLARHVLGCEPRVPLSTDDRNYAPVTYIFCIFL